MHHSKRASPRCPAPVLSRAVLAFALIVACPGAKGGEIVGQVIRVADGDTLTVLVQRQSVRVRLVEIDAPEKRQSFGSRSGESLAELCLNKSARIDAQGVDRYGRVLGRVSCAGVDANAEQVRRGMAWVFDRYATDASLYAEQKEARAAHRGLWADPRPVAPWTWRGTQKAGKR